MRLLQQVCSMLFNKLPDFWTHPISFFLWNYLLTIILVRFWSSRKSSIQTTIFAFRQAGGWGELGVVRGTASASCRSFWLKVPGSWVRNGPFNSLSTDDFPLIMTNYIIAIETGPPTITMGSSPLYSWWWKHLSQRTQWWRGLKWTSWWIHWASASSQMDMVQPH